MPDSDNVGYFFRANPLTSSVRILHLIPTLSGGGAERQLSYLAPALTAAGHEVHIAYVNVGAGSPDLPGVFLHQFRQRNNHSPLLLLDVCKIVNEIRPHLIQTWIMQMDILGGIAARIAGIPWFFREPSSALAYKATWKNRLRVLMGSAACGVISNSCGGDAYWTRHIPANRRHIIANALALAEIEAVAPKWPEQLPNFAAPMALYVGRLASDITARKNLRVFLQAIAHARKSREIVGVLCGDGPQRRELEQLRLQLGLEGAVHFTGYLPPQSVFGLIKHAAMFVSLSEYEGCPNTVMEAMACGCPLVVSEIPAHREILDEKAAIFVDPCDISQSATALLAVLTAPDLARSHALSAKRVTKSWSVSSMADKYLRIYQQFV